MKINQNKEQLYVKSLNEIESAVLSVVKKFFEKNPEELYGSIDNIIVEVLRRIKMELINGTIVPSVSSVNGKKGEVTLTYDDVKAEPVINKLTAFNKNFGNEVDTVCEGNDPRLSDKRQPLGHEHENYLTSTTINNAIEKFLNSKGMYFGEGDDINIYINNRNLMVSDGEIKEVEDNGQL